MSYSERAHLVAFPNMWICKVELRHFLTVFLKPCLFVNIFHCEHIYVAVCVCAHAHALIEEALGRESTINWATWISHAQLMRLKCVEQQRREGIADHTHTHKHALTHKLKTVALTHSGFSSTGPRHTGINKVT